uniref:uncharacterized protein LOC117165433 n=1 Tax=Bombus vancouverensis nearcticus TaxID=2705178 RepID=UPI001439655F|nr:uncharacterized protein LOC117165433 [Bombus vancouverensis nearcticus]
MTSEDQLISLRRRRGYCSGRFTYLSNRLDEYEQSGSQQNSLLTNYEKQLTEVASQFEAIQLELEVLDEEEQVRGFEIRDQYVAVDTRLQNLLRNAQTASPSTSINPPTCASSDNQGISNAIKALSPQFKQHIYALNKLGESYLDTSAMLNSLILSKIPLSIQKQWEMTLPNNEVPPYIHLLNFLERLARSSRPITTVRQTRESPEQTTPVLHRASRGHALTATQVTPTCPTCQGPHPIWKCDTFKTKSLRERIREVKRASLCVNCLGKGHTTQHCFAGSCRVCGERHHTMLHRTKRHSGSRSSTSSPKSSPSNTRSTTPSLPPYVSPTRRKRHPTDHRSEKPRTAASPSPPPIDKRTHNQ